MRKLRLVLWFGDAPFQRFQAHRFVERFEVVGAVFEQREVAPFQKSSLTQLVDKVASRLLLPSVHRGWKECSAVFSRECPGRPQVETMLVENINSDESFHFSSQLNPDLILVSGTRMVRDRLLSIPTTMGILNLHTGLSPYINGGPSCTNWCIATGQTHLIGNTVMWIDEGIDSGNVVYTDLTQFSGSEKSLSDVYLKVFRHGQQMYEDVVKLLHGDPEACPSVPQSRLGEGRTYYTREWGFWQKLLLVKNFKSFHADLVQRERRLTDRQVKLIGLPQTDFRGTKARRSGG